MRYLLDTSVLLWWVENDPLLNDKHRQVIADPSNLIYVSITSFWEIAIKAGINKIRLQSTLEDLFLSSGTDLLEISLTHLSYLQKLPAIHKDPFDRLLIAQAKSEKLTLITSDSKIKRYPVKTL